MEQRYSTHDWRHLYSEVSIYSALYTLVIVKCSKLSLPMYSRTTQAYGLDSVSSASHNQNESVHLVLISKIEIPYNFQLQFEITS